MTDKLPPNLLALFAPRPALRYLTAPDHAIEHRTTSNISGIGSFLKAVNDAKANDEEYHPTESWLQKRDRIKMEKKEAQQQLHTEGVKAYIPAEDPQVRGEPYKTLFVTRLSYDAETKDLEREFGRFGPIERVRRCFVHIVNHARLILSQIRIVKKPNGEESASKKKKNTGYAFIVFEREKDMKGKHSKLFFFITIKGNLRGHD